MPTHDSRRDRREFLKTAGTLAVGLGLCPRLGFGAEVKPPAWSAETMRPRVVSSNCFLSNSTIRLLAARGESPAAFGRRCIPADCVAPSSNIPDILGRRALSAGRLAALGATPDFHHRLLGHI